MKGKELFGFDEARNLTALLGTNTKTLYRYDGNHHRTMIQQGETVTYTIHNRAGQLLAEYTPSHSKTYLYHRNQLMARIDKTGNQESIHYYHTDLLGSPIAQSNKQSQLDWQETYAPYGKRLLQQGKDNGQWYTGKTEDKETGFIYLNARYYDPEIARFISPDPVYFKEQNPFSFNRYAYANNNPLKFVDPDGKDAIYINYDYYPVDIGYGVRLPLGHSAVVAVNPKTGTTKYFEYGRYGGDFGKARNKWVPDLVMQRGNPTAGSLENLYNYASKYYGQNTSVSATYYQDVDYQKVVNFGFGRIRDKNRLPYSIWGNNCKTFARDAIEPKRN